MDKRTLGAHLESSSAQALACYSHPGQGDSQPCSGPNQAGLHPRGASVSLSAYMARGMPAAGAWCPAAARAWEQDIMVTGIACTGGSRHPPVPCPRGCPGHRTGLPAGNWGSPGRTQPLSPSAAVSRLPDASVLRLPRLGLSSPARQYSISASPTTQVSSPAPCPLSPDHSPALQPRFHKTASLPLPRRPGAASQAPQPWFPDALPLHPRCSFLDAAPPVPLCRRSPSPLPRSPNNAALPPAPRAPAHLLLDVGTAVGVLGVLVEVAHGGVPGTSGAGRGC